MAKIKRSREQCSVITAIDVSWLLHMADVTVRATKTQCMKSLMMRFLKWPCHGRDMTVYMHEMADKKHRKTLKIVFSPYKIPREIRGR